VPTGARIAREKRLALANCNGLLVRACDELDALMGRRTASRFEREDADELGAAAMRVIELRRHRRRLEAELHAIVSEWAAD
jgi:hypothetical protein